MVSRRLSGRKTSVLICCKSIDGLPGAIFNFVLRGEILAPGVKLAPRGEVGPQG
jgi:hypothetical protein